jgi:RHS repeat-associated protein
MAHGEYCINENGACFCHSVDAMYRSWIIHCACQDPACDSTGDVETTCEDLVAAVQKLDDKLEEECGQGITNEELCEFLRCFLRECADEWCESNPTCLSGCGTEWDPECEDICDQIADCVEQHILPGSLTPALAECIDEGVAENFDNEGVPFLCEVEEDCCKGDPVYWSCGAHFQTDRDGSGIVDCADLQQFIAESAANCPGGAGSRADIIDLVEVFLQNDGASVELCADLRDCVDGILANYGGGYSALNQSEFDGLFALGCDDFCTGAETSEGSPEKEGDEEDDSCGGDNEGHQSETGVELSRGDQLERHQLLSLPALGLDLSLSMTHTSNSEFSSSCGLGDGWSMSGFEWVDFVDGIGPGDPTLTFKGSAAGQRTVVLSGTPTEWPLPGPTSQTVRKGGVVIDESGIQRPVWILKEPGQWEKLYYRANEEGEGDPEDWFQVPDSLVGAFLQKRDVHGNRHTYDRIETVGGGHLDSGLVWLIVVNGDSLLDLDGNRNGDVPRLADVLFDYITLDANPALNGRLRTVYVYRYPQYYEPVYPEPSGDLTHFIRFRYMDENDAALSPDLGNTGDLIQVIESVRVDPAPGGTSQPTWRHHITQYRYHGNTESSGSVEERDYDWQSVSGQLKLVIQAEQIEYAAQRQGEADEAMVDIVEFAESLLAKDDDALAWDDGSTLVVDLAQKVNEKYETSGQERILSQHVQSACGCSGGTQGQKLVYSYIDRNSDAEDAETVSVSEYRLIDGEYEETAYRTRYYEYIHPSGAPGPYLQSEATVIGSDAWVDYYTYDSSRNVERHYHPSAVTSYEPGDEEAEPQYTFASGTGLVHRYEYTSDQRLAATFVGTGDSVLTELSDWVLLETQEYGDLGESPWSSTNTRPHLVSRTKRYRATDGEVDDPNDETIEVARYRYGFHANDAIAWAQTDVEAELEAENGPGGWYTSYELYDAEGKNYWSIAADGSYTKREYDLDEANGQSGTGQVVRVIQNADRDVDGFDALPSAAKPSSPPADRNADGGSMVSEVVYDLLGRVQETVTPGLVSTYTRREMRTCDQRPWIRYYAEVTLPHIIDEEEAEFNGPATITWMSAGGSTIAASTYSLSLGLGTAPPGYSFAGAFESGYYTLITDYSLGSERSRSATVHAVSGLVEREQRWHDLGADPYETIHTYDELGRVQYTTNANGTITQSVYDALDRVTETWIGTDNGDPGNMTLVAESFYDHDAGPVSGVGDGNLTYVRQHVDSSTTRDTVYVLDARNRLYKTINSLPPHEFVVHDNQDRVTARGLFTAEPAAIDDPLDDEEEFRGRYEETSYSQRGLVFRSAQAIDPTAAEAEFLESHSWYDEVGRVVADWTPGGPKNKITFNGLGLAVATYVTVDASEARPGAASNYAAVHSSHASVLTGDTVLEQTEFSYISGTGLVELVKTRERTHDADDTGSLASATAQEVITSFHGTFYDAADRVIITADYGTAQPLFQYGGSVSISQSSPPSASDTVLVTVVEYDDRGISHQITAPDGSVSRTFYDGLGRTIAVAENYDEADPIDVTWSAASGRWVVDGLSYAARDENRVTSFVHDGLDNIRKRVAHYPDSSDDEQVQVTEYVHGVTEGTDGSLVTSNDLLYQIIYPDGDAASTVADRTATHGYNQLGELVYLEDLNGTVHSYDRDALGRQTLDSVTVGSGIDDAVRSIGTEFNALGQRIRVTSYNVADPTPMASEVENEVVFSYTRLWQIEQFWQQHDDPVDTETSYVVTYAYDDSDITGDNRSRLTSITYGDGTEATYSYGATDGTNDLLSRVDSIGIDGETYPLVRYQFAGLGRAVIVDLPGLDNELDVQLDYSADSEGNRQFETYADSPGLYAGLDRFGRVIEHRWVDGVYTTGAGSNPSNPVIAAFAYTYDRASNRTSRNNVNTVLGEWVVRDEEFRYDGLDRLTETWRGQRTAGTAGDWNCSNFDIDASSTSWDLDMLGNWESFNKTAQSSCTYTVDEARTHTDANEIVTQDLDGAGGHSPLDFDYDKAGNLVLRETGSGTTKYLYTYDAWNRLVEIKHQSGSNPAVVRGSYRYNGLNHRIAKQADTNTNGTVEQERLVYFTPSWQMIDELVDDDLDTSAGTDRRVQYFWGSRYIDDIVCRREDRDLDEDYSASPDITRYYCTDVQFSPVAILDDSADVVERIGFTPYGEARHHRMSDLNGDRKSTGSDLAIIASNDGTFGPGDLDRDGEVEDGGDDSSIASADAGLALSAGLLSFASEDNVLGYCGNPFDEEVRQYTVRHRVYEPTLGRWLQRDPIGFATGSNVYSYVNCTPITAADPMGLLDLQGPPAMIVSWIDRMSAADELVATLSVMDAYEENIGPVNLDIATAIAFAVSSLNAIANPRPPAWSPSAAALQRYLKQTKEHRGFTGLRPRICCDDGMVRHVVDWAVVHENGYTPMRLPGTSIYNKALGWTTTTSDGAGNPCITFTTIGTGQLSPIENLMQSGLTGRMAPFISRRIDYRICCDSRVRIDYAGSYFPSHRAYLGTEYNIDSIHDALQDNSRLGEFGWSTGVVPPRRFVTAFTHANEAQDPDGGVP